MGGHKSNSDGSGAAAIAGEENQDEDNNDADDDDDDGDDDCDNECSFLEAQMLMTSDQAQRLGRSASLSSKNVLV